MSFKLLATVAAVLMSSVVTQAETTEALVVKVGEPAPKKCGRSKYCLVANASTSVLSVYINRRLAYAYPVVMQNTLEERWGNVTQIDLEPTWCVGQIDVALSADEQRLEESLYGYFLRKGGDPSDLDENNCLAFGHPLNPMGDIKYHINGDFAGTGIRIHGTPGYPEAFEETETFGCVRLMNGATGTRHLLAFHQEMKGVAAGIRVGFTNDGA